MVGEASVNLLPAQTLSGVNRIHHTDALTLLRSLSDDSVDLVLTDIPYAEVNRGSNGLRLLDKGNADVLTFPLRKFLRECERVCKGSIYIFCGIEQVSIIRRQFKRTMSTRHCIWEKTNPSPMNGEYLWLSSIENCVYAKKQGATFNEFCKSSVWKFPAGSSSKHPTEKSLALFQYLIETSSREGDIVLDPCVGSGTTAVAARNTKRRYICGDLSSDYVLIARDRLRLPFEKRHTPANDDVSGLPLFAAALTASA